MAVLTGAQIVSEDIGAKLENVTSDKLGKTRKVAVSKESTVIVDGGDIRSDIKTRIAQIRIQWDKASSEYEKRKLYKKSWPG